MIVLSIMITVRFALESVCSIFLVVYFVMETVCLYNDHCFFFIFNIIVRSAKTYFLPHPPPIHLIQRTTKLKL